MSVVDGSNAGKAALTDSTGRYSLTDLSAGGFSIRVRREGFDDLVRPVTPALAWTGSFAGTLSGTTGLQQYAGSLTITALINTGSGRCNGTRSSVTGSASATQLTLPAPGLWRFDECVDEDEDIVITLNKPAPAGPRAR